MLPVAIFRFSPTEGPGHFADWLDSTGVPSTLFALDSGASVPADPARFSGIGMMGGPMSVNDALPWISPMTGLLRGALAGRVPVIGHCLGGQLLAKAMGATVERSASPELGWVGVTATDATAQREWFGGKPGFTAFQWHYDAFQLPPGATRVLTNAFNREQAFIVDDLHIGMQFHVEMTRALIESWLETGADELPRKSSDAVQSAAEMRAGIAAHLAQLSVVAENIYARWAKALRN